MGLWWFLVYTRERRICKKRNGNGGLSFRSVDYAGAMEKSPTQEQWKLREQRFILYGGYSRQGLWRLPWQMDSFSGFFLRQLPFPGD